MTRNRLIRVKIRSDRITEPLTMFANSPRPPRPRLTLRIFLYGVADIFGLTCIAISAIWLIKGQHVLTTGFPNSVAEAVAGLLGGAAVMLWSVAHILREMMKQNLADPLAETAPAASAAPERPPGA